MKSQLPAIEVIFSVAHQWKEPRVSVFKQVHCVHTLTYVTVYKDNSKATKQTSGPNHRP